MILKKIKGYIRTSIYSLIVSHEVRVVGAKSIDAYKNVAHPRYFFNNFVVPI